MSIIFTGRGYDLSGTFQKRSFWESIAMDMGLAPNSEVTSPGDLLVASRDDTRKAKEARSIGADILTYQQFHRRYLTLVDQQSRKRREEDRAKSKPQHTVVRSLGVLRTRRKLQI